MAGLRIENVVMRVSEATLPSTETILNDDKYGLLCVSFYVYSYYKCVDGV